MFPYKKFIVLVLFLLVFSSGSLAKNFYVSHEGGPTRAGTEADPWNYRSIDWAAMGGGDTLYIVGTMRGFAAPFMVGSEGSSEDSRFVISSYPEDPGKIWAGQEIDDTGWLPGPCDSYYKNVGGAKGVQLLEWITDPWTAKELVDAGVAPSNDCSLWQAAGLFYHDHIGSVMYYKPSDALLTGKTLTKIASTQYGIEIDGRNFVKIEKLKISQSVTIGPYNPSHNFWIDGCEIENFYHPQGGILVNRDGKALGSNYGRVSNNILANGGNGVYIINQRFPNEHNSSYWHIYNNKISNMQGTIDSHGIGIQGGHDHLVEFNEIYECGSGITWWAHDGQDLYNNVARFNYIQGAKKRPDGGNGRGIEFSPDNDVLLEHFYNNDIYSNIVNTCGGAGIRWKSGDRQSEVYNNTVYNCAPNYQHQTPTQGHSMVAFIFKNNISVSPAAAEMQYHVRVAPGLEYGMREGDIDNNLYYPTEGELFFTPDGACDYLCWSARLDLGTPDNGTSVRQHPQFASSTLANWTDFRLSPSSSAIDAGEKIVGGDSAALDPSRLVWPPSLVDQNTLGAAWEIGAFGSAFDKISAPTNVRILQ